MDELKPYLAYLPPRFRDEVLALAQGKKVEEIRLRRNMPFSLTCDGKNIRGSLRMTPEEAEETLFGVCGGSLHTHIKTLKEGYVSLPDGSRVAIVGLAVIQNGKIETVRDITAISFRISRCVKGNASPILEYMEKTDFSEGVLLFSLPGAGKTTLLRELAIRLSSPPYLRRVALIDSALELYRPKEFHACLCDPLRGYPKAEGIATAVRYLSPQILICDEIGTEQEAASILNAHPAGVPLIASIHGKRATEICQRPSISALLSHGVFGTMFRLEREKSQVRLFREEIEKSGGKD